MRLIDINLLKFKFRNKLFDYAIFQNDRTNNILAHLIEIFNKKNITTILPEIAYFSSEYYITSRSTKPSNYIEEDGLFSYLFSENCAAAWRRCSFWYPQLLQNFLFYPELFF